MPIRCELNCSWSLIAALFYKLTFLPSITDPVQYKRAKTDLAQFTHKIKVWSGSDIVRWKRVIKRKGRGRETERERRS